MLEIKFKVEPKGVSRLIPIGILRLMFQEYLKKIEKVFKFQFKIVDLKVESVIV